MLIRRLGLTVYRLHRISSRRYCTVKSKTIWRKIFYVQIVLVWIAFFSVRFPITINWMLLDTLSLNICGVDAVFSSVQTYLCAAARGNVLQAALSTAVCPLWRIGNVSPTASHYGMTHTCKSKRTTLSSASLRTQKPVSCLWLCGQVFLLVLIF